MKIGKTDFKKMALNILENDWIGEQLETATSKITEAIRTIENQAVNLEKKYEEERMAVAHLESKSSLTQDEYFELEGTLGWMESYFEDAQLQINSLSQGLIIVASNFMKQVLKNAKGYYHYGKVQPDTESTLMKIGPKINLVFWADALNAASNYVRHSDEWIVNQYEKIILADGSTAYREVLDVIGLLGRPDSKRNATTIDGIGIPAKDFLVHKHDISRRLTKELSLDDSSKLRSMFTSWQVELTAFVKTKVP